jgi:hypothetical protein
VDGGRREIFAGANASSPELQDRVDQFLEQAGERYLP